MQLKQLKRIDRFVRKTRDRIFLGTPPFPDINHLLHHVRGEAFKAAPKGAQHLVSVGCAGTWYFNWINDTYGHVAKHTGVEFYSPKPADLPTNAEWIANTAGHMPQIQSDSADGVFSGQNLEHLWPEDVCGFYLESHRILKEGGLLIVDSPNRLVTTKYNWSHPEHTVELTPDEAVELTTLAGFDVTTVKGLWLCESPDGNKLYPFSEMKHYGSDSFHRRISQSQNHPDQSFLWWVEARRARRTPDESSLRSKMTEIWDHAWPERCRRTLTIVGKLDETSGTFESRGEPGVLMYGPYLPLRKGTYSATFRIKLAKPAVNSTDTIRIDIVGRDGSLELAMQEVRLVEMSCHEWHEFPITFAVQDTTFGTRFRVIVPAGSVVEANRDILLTTEASW